MLDICPKNEIFKRLHPKVFRDPPKHVIIMLDICPKTAGQKKSSWPSKKKIGHLKHIVGHPNLFWASSKEALNIQYIFRTSNHFGYRKNVSTFKTFFFNCPKGTLVPRTCFECNRAKIKQKTDGLMNKQKSVRPVSVAIAVAIEILTVGIAVTL